MIDVYANFCFTARSKLRNRKKAKRARLVACPPLFPAIIEHVAEEQKEMMEVELQPESPLTPIYCTISRKEPVMWPAFLGDWAYNADDILHRGKHCLSQFLLVSTFLCTIMLWVRKKI